MAMGGFAFICRGNSYSFPFRCRSTPIIHCARKVRHSSSIATVETELSAKEEAVGSTKVSGDLNTMTWKRLNSKELGVKISMISKPTREVLDGLRKKGYEVYLVGGCVRDLILKRTPKDFDIITSAELRQVMRAFPRCEIVGKRFPICHVHIDDSIIEVSSFSTSRRKSDQDYSFFSRRPPGCDVHDYNRWRNCLGRDFTINGLMFDPYAKLVYDYLGGMDDIKKAKVRTIIPAQMSFQEDCARILRAVRIAARLGFRFARDTALSLKDLSCSLLKLDKSRLLMEMNYMLAYGSSEASLRLLWKYGLLDILLPIQAAYFVSQGFRRRDERSNMLLTLFSNLDRLLSPNRPCHSSLWVAMLAFHQALVDEPQNPLVVAAFTLAINNGGDLSEAVNIARGIKQPHDGSFDELLAPEKIETDSELKEEVLDLASSVRSTLSLMTDEYFVSNAMAKYPQAPYSDMGVLSERPKGRFPFPTLSSMLYDEVLLLSSLALDIKSPSMEVLKIFECLLKSDGDRRVHSKRGNKINYEYLAQGELLEVRHTFARVVFDTIYP